MKLSVIIPVYNEQATIKHLLDKVITARLPDKTEKEIIVINDGSDDHTGEILARYQDLPEFKILSHPVNLGKSAAVVSGIRKSSGEIIVIQDGDLEYNPDNYRHLLQPILKKETRVVYGSRFLGTIRDMAPINRWANNLSNLTLRLLYGVRVTDLHTCHKMFLKNALKTVEIKSDGFSVDTELTAKFLNRGIQIREIPISYTARSRSDGKKITWLKALKAYACMIRCRITKA